MKFNQTQMVYVFPALPVCFIFRLYHLKVANFSQWAYFLSLVQEAGLQKP